MNTPGLNALTWFLVIIALIPLALWLLKRTPMGGGISNSMMRSISVLPISPSQRIMTVEVGTGSERRWLVLGVTAQQITTLHSMAPQEEVSGGSPLKTPATGFSQLMSHLRSKNPGAGA